MRLLILGFVFFQTTGFAFEPSKTLHCINGGTIRVESDSTKKSYYKRNLSIPLSGAGKVIFLVKNKVVAKVYPQAGVDFFVLDKTYKIQSDNRSFWKISNSSSDALFTCELKNE